MDRLRDVAVDLGCESELLYVREIAQDQDWAERQRDILRVTGDSMQVVKQLSDRARISPA